jgi:hypothetical protein
MSFNLIVLVTNTYGTFETAIFWDVMLFCFADRYRLFGGVFCILNYADEKGRRCFETIRCHILEDSNLQGHRRENIKFHKHLYWRSTGILPLEGRHVYEIKWRIRPITQG